MGACCGCRSVSRTILLPLCGPSVQSHTLDVAPFLLGLVARPEELSWVHASRSCRPVASASSSPSSTGIVPIASLKGTGIAADAVRRRASRWGLQTQQGAWVLRRGGEYRPLSCGGRRVGRQRRARCASIPAWRHRLGFDAHAGVCVHGQHGALR